MTPARLLLLAALGGSAWWLMRDDGIRHGPGVIAPDTPVQTEAQDVQPFDYRGYAIAPLARFELKARVLGREDYRLDRESELATVDLALGWGPMSDERVLEKITITQGGRWYRWRAQELPVPRREIQVNSANMHLIPGDDAVEDALDEVRTGHVVELRGFLVEARASDGWRWRSSLTRNDNGARSCELVFVEHLAVVGPE